MARSALRVRVGRHVVGNALVLHVRDRISSEAQSLALAVAEDAEHDIVLLDLHGDLPVGLWEAVARELPRRRRGIRLLVCGAGPDVAVLAGQWLADRLGRAVLVPHGHLLRGAAGVLFVHAAQDSGWIRNLPGRAPDWAGRRYPRPAWDDAAAAYLPTSAYAVVEPLPGGVWIRDTRHDDAVTGHWQWLASAVPCQPQALTVLLGCPGTPELPLDDVARFWRGLPDEGRRHARFVHYGPVRLPAGEPLGQALADVLGTPVVCFAGVPVGRPEQPRLHTVPADGRLGWQVHVRELGYRPRSRIGVPAAPPQIVSHRVPEVLGEEVAPRVHRYTPDAVVEILQSGLWVRPPRPPRHAARVRARPADPAGHVVVVDDATPALVPRLRELAEDLVARLDDATRTRSVLQLASAVAVSTVRPPTPAAGALPDGLTYRFTAAELGLDRAPRPMSPAAAEPPAEPTVTLPRNLGSTTAGPAEGVLGPAADPARPPAAARTTRTPLAAVLPVAETPAGPSTPDTLRPTPAGTGPPPEASGPPRPAPEPTRPWHATAEQTGRTGRTGQAGEIQQTGQPQQTGEPRTTRSPRFQPEPGPEARAVPDPGSRAAERAWLRQTLPREFDAAAATVTRLLAAYPGPHTSPDAVADAVAVRLYLSPVADGLDAALREGRPGAQLPLARCVAAGLTRLPSHRGPAVLRAELTADDLATIASRGVLTDWGFTNALVEPAVGLPGTVDVLIWSITGHRTRLLEPADGTGVPARVLFRPGTSFKVLATRDPAPDRPGELVLRELAPDEPRRQHVPFDDLALASLRRAVQQWTAGSPTALFGAAASGRFTVVPGLC